MSGNSKELKSKLSKYMKAPIKFLIKARDFYIQSMTHCSSVVGYGSAMGCPSGQLGSGLPRSFSATSAKSRSGSEEYGELLRLASLRNLRSKIESELSGRRSSDTRAVGVRRSCSVGIGRIDEDEACEFVDHDVKLISTDLYSRSRSYAPRGTVC